MSSSTLLPAHRPGTDFQPAAARLGPLLDPDSLVIVGASSNFSRIGGAPIQSLLDGGFPKGKLLLVNSKYSEIEGIPCYSTIESLPWTPTLAILAIRMSETLPMLVRCHAKGIRAAVLFAAGFAEVDAQGQRAQQELVDADRALDVLEEAVDRAALGTVAEALGAMEAVLEITNEYIKTRVQFGGPIGRFQALQHRMAEMFIETQECRSILYRGLAHIDAAPSERKAAVSAAKVCAANAGRFVGSQGIQLHGGVGMTEEYQVGHYFKKLVTLEKLFGDGDYHIERFASMQQVGPDGDTPND